jgi:predicted RNA binding protein YcfA (HicA-like mRNA interferase family)
MGALHNISGKEAAKAFEKAGWQAIGQVGSHLVMVKSGMRVNLSIPQHTGLLARPDPSLLPPALCSLPFT